MALRDNPYLPLYIQDFLTDEKLIECSAQSTGVYIRLMCIMHKSEHYGKILLKQKDKQTSEQIKNFALKVAKQMPYTEVVVESSLAELLSEKVLYIDGDYLIQRRMVRDCEISTKRALAGKEGGKKTASAIDFAVAKVQANADNENDIDIDNDSDNKNESDSVCDINTSSDNSTSSDSKRDSTKKKEKNIPEFAVKLAEYLKEKIVESGTDMVLKDSHLTGWADDFRLMVTSDKRTVEDIQKKIDDIFVDSFWSKQIRSAGKMREQWKVGKLDGLKPKQTAIGQQQTNSDQGVDLYASEKRYDSGRCRRYIDAMLRRLFPVGDKWEEYIIPDNDAELRPIWDIIVADGGYINGVKTKEAALEIVSMLRKYT